MVPLISFGEGISFGGGDHENDACPVRLRRRTLWMIGCLLGCLVRESGPSPWFFPDGSGPGLMSLDHRTVQPPDFCVASLSILLVTLVVSVLIDIPLTALFAQVAVFWRPIIVLVDFRIGSRTFRATLFRGYGWEFAH
jgi:hypothetical protein